MVARHCHWRVLNAPVTRFKRASDAFQRVAQRATPVAHLPFYICGALLKREKERKNEERVRKKERRERKRKKKRGERKRRKKEKEKKERERERKRREEKKEKKKRTYWMRSSAADC
jgi:hypothetical protein